MIATTFAPHAEVDGLDSRGRYQEITYSSDFGLFINKTLITLKKVHLACFKLSVEYASFCFDRLKKENKLISPRLTVMEKIIEPIPGSDQDSELYKGDTVFTTNLAKISL